MGEIKTKPTDLDIDNFLMNVEPEKRRKDSMECYSQSKMSGGRRC